jgi:hypothetical protein
MIWSLYVAFKVMSTYILKRFKSFKLHNIKFYTHLICYMINQNSECKCGLVIMNLKLILKVICIQQLNIFHQSRFSCISHKICLRLRIYIFKKILNEVANEIRQIFMYFISFEDIKLYIAQEENSAHHLWQISFSITLDVGSNEFH